ncbi:MAG: TIGR00297 family protein [Acidobacteriota bacterium]
MSSGLTLREVARKVTHMGVGLIAFAVVYLGPLYSALFALAALLMNIFILPRVGGKLLWRADDERRGQSVGIIAYPAAVLVLILLFWNHLEIAAGVWGILAFGDGMASIVGMTLGGPRLPWNPRKTWSGLFGYALFGTIGAFTLLWWTLERGGESFHSRAFLLLVAAGTAAFAALIESQPIELDDNISVPLLAALVMHGLMLTESYWPRVDEKALLVTFLVGAGVNLALAVPAYLARSVDRTGFVAGILVGATIWMSLGWKGWLVLVVFFVLGTGATKIGYKKKAERKLAQEGGGRRSARHALANTAVPTIAAFFAASTPHPEIYLPAFVAAFATAAGDTLGSEIGQLWGRRTFLITTLRPVPRGTEGAVSLEGTLAGLFGSFAVACLGWALGFYGFAVALLVTLAAFIGTTLESLIGATIEKAGLLDNESVNFLNTLIGAVTAALLVMLLG